MKASTIEAALQATGEQLAAAGSRAAIVVVGGATLAITGLVQRATDDVDVIALAERSQDGSIRLQSAVPLPESITRAASRVARDLALPTDWLNAVVGKQFTNGLPPGLAEDITWRRYAALDVGFAGRRSLIALKLFAAVDCSPESVHTQDLIALAPTRGELDQAATWVATQDASPHFPSHLAKVIDHVIKHTR
ncbi:MAG: hypothetical protein ACREL5_12270 [Gemmatimonadales bacterium]